MQVSEPVLHETFNVLAQVLCLDGVVGYLQVDCAKVILVLHHHGLQG